MKVNQIIEKVRKDWAVILICFLVSILIYVFHQTSLIEKRSFVIPIETVENGDFMVTGDFVNKATVSVKANPEDSASVHSSLLRAYVNLDTITRPGDYQLPVCVDIAEELLSYDPFEVSVKPESVKVHVEERGTKYLKIVPVVIGEPAHGYELSEVEIEPQFVRAMGPQSILNTISSVNTAAVDITDLEDDGVISVNCDQLNKLVKLDSNGPYSVSVYFDYVYDEMVFENISIQQNKLSENLILKTEIPQTSITLKGTLLNLESFLIPKNCAVIDFSSITEPGQYEVEIKYNIPSRFELTNKALEKVSVVIENVPPVEAVIEEKVEAE